MNTVFKKSWLKSVLAVFMIALTVFVIAACEKAADAQEVIDLAKDNVKLVYGSGDSKDSVTKDITLPTSLNSDLGAITISWASNNEAVLKVQGSTAKVTRPQTDTQVTLTASLKLNDAVATVPFVVNVKKVDVNPQELLDALKLEGVEYDATNDRYTTDKDINLVADLGGFAVTWTSSNPAVIANDGKVTQPAWDASNQLVTMTAKIGTAEKDFRIVVLKLAEKPVSAKLADAANVLLIPGTTDGVSGDLELATTAGTEGVTVTWSSSNPDVITNEGAVTLLDELVEVTLTATLSLEGESITKDFDLKVIAAPESVDVADIDAAFAWIQGDTDKENPRNLYVKLTGVTVVAVSGDGFIVADESNVMFIYTNANPSKKVKLNDVVDVYGVMSNYNAVLQLQGKTGFPLRIIKNTEAEVVEVEAEAITSVSSFIADLGTKHPNHEYSLNDPVAITKYVLTAKVLVQASSEGNYNTFLVDPNFTGSVNSASNSPMTVDALMIYYNSNIAAIRLFNGLEVELEVWLYSRRTDRNIYTVIFTGVADDIQTTSTNAEIIDTVAEGIQAGIAEEYETATTIALPKSLLGATITYSSESPLVNVETGAITMPANGQETVEIKAVITREGATKEVTISILIGEKPVQSIESVYEADNDALVKVQGVVTAITITDSTYNNGHMMLQDETGGLIAYRVAKSELLKVKVGDLIVITGNKTVGNGTVRLKDGTTTIVKIISSDNVVAPVVVTTATQLKDLTGQLVSVTGYLKQAITTVAYGTNYTVILADGTEVIARSVSDGDSTEGDLASLSALNGLAAGTQVTIVTAVDFYSNPQLALYKTAKVTAGEKASNEVLAEFIKDSDLKLPAASTEVKADLVLPTTSLFGTVITWTSDNAAITAAGKVTRGEADVVVTLSYVAKLGDIIVKEGSIEFTVLKADENEPTLLYSYNFNDGGSSSNNGYANTNLATNVSYAENNPGGEGTTAWIANYANLSLTYGTRLGGKLESNPSRSNLESANIRTNFKYAENITKVEILGATTFGNNASTTLGNIYLQSSTDGETWTTVGTSSLSATITYNNLNIAAGSYIRIVIDLVASGTNSGLQFTGLQITGIKA